MMRSMYSSVSGLKVHQNKMDVLGDNISNVNTAGYKSSRASFQELMNQTLEGASAPADGRGGTNPMQIGLGVDMSSIDKDMSTGSLQSTGKDSDVAIDGDGFFTLSDGSQEVYSRVGNFTFDSEGYLTNSDGLRVQGWQAEDGEIENESSQDIEDITLRRSMNPEASGEIKYDGNLDSGASNVLEILNPQFAVEEAGEEDDVSVELEQVSGEYNQWEFVMEAENSEFTNNSTSDDANQFTGSINLNKDGEIEEMENADGDDISGGSGNEPELDVNTSGNNLTFATQGIGDTIGDDPLFESSGTDSTEVEAKYDLEASREITTDVFDSQGNKHDVTLDAEKSGFNTWSVEEENVEVSDAVEPSGGWFGGDDYTLEFDDSGELENAGATDFGLTFEPEGLDEEQNVELNFDEVTQFSGEMTANFQNVDGYSEGDLQSFSIDGNGNINGSYDNGQNLNQARISLARFSNAEGLNREGGVYQESNNSGDALIGGPDSGGRGELAPSTLEMSNVDLSEQFTEMVTSQRGYQANSKIITTSDEMLQELVNIKR
ncbi:MAG: flagellar hook protein FlgE [Bacillota bacterium]